MVIDRRIWVSPRYHTRDRVWRHNPRPLPLACDAADAPAGRSTRPASCRTRVCSGATGLGRGDSTLPAAVSPSELLAAAADDDLAEEAVLLVADARGGGLAHVAPDSSFGADSYPSRNAAKHKRTTVPGFRAGETLLGAQARG